MDCFKFGDILNKAAINICIKIFPWTFLLDLYLLVLDVYLILVGSAKEFCRVGACFILPAAMCESPSYSRSLPTLTVVSLVNSSHLSEGAFVSFY